MPNLEIIADHIGPIISLKNGNGELSSKQQNLIFARNGMGKSFLSRALRHLDLHQHLDTDQQENNMDKAADNLVSEESPNNEGGFEIKSGSDILGKLKLKKGNNNVDETAKPEIGDKIFHVFCSEFVQEELRERENAFQPDEPDPDRKIATVDGPTIELQDKESVLKIEEEKRDKTHSELSTIFNAKKEEMKKDANIRGSLSAFRELDCDIPFLQEHKEKPSESDESSSETQMPFAELKAQLKKLTSIPDSLEPPEEIKKELNVPEQLLSSISESLEKKTSPTTIADDIIKKKIDEHSDFFKSGLDIRGHDPDTCPFCGQETTSEETKETIETYIKYFQEEEAQEKEKLGNHRDDLEKIKTEVENIQTRTNAQQIRYDALREYIPSQSKSNPKNSIESVNAHIEAIIDEIEKLKEKIKNKGKDLEEQISVDEKCKHALISHYNSLNEIIKKNDKKFSELNNICNDEASERRNIQGRLCQAFKIEFANTNRAKINEWHTTVEAIERIKDEINELKEKQDTEEYVREKAAKTFHELLYFFFNNKYTFCKDEFVIKRGDDEMSRGADRTLSDGEKTIIGFCWFIASIHLKVESDSDYKKLFLVFDDPMTSLSYDYIFSMADVLKSLSISSAGTITVSPKTNPERPQILLLTHSDSFFNICLSNSVVKKEACFALEIDDNSEHKLSELPTEYIIPFQSQLKHIHDVKQRQQPPAFYTANSIRSVLEFFFRICRPHEAENMVTIAESIYTNYEINIRRVLLHGHSHGNHVECNSENELIQACEDTIKVISKLEIDPRQIASLDKMLADEEVS